MAVERPTPERPKAYTASEDLGIKLERTLERDHVQEAVRKVLAQFCHLTKGQRALIIHDCEDAKLLWTFVREIVRLTNCYPTPISIPAQYQDLIGQGGGLSNMVPLTIQQSDIVFLVSRGITDGHVFREVLAKTCKEYNKPLIGVLGTSYEDIQSQREVDYSEIAHLSEVIARMLQMPGAEVKIVTEDVESSYTLELRLAPKSRTVKALDGVMSREHVNRIPTGMVCVAPDETSASGKLVIAGTLGARSIHQRSAAIMAFERGKLVACKRLPYSYDTRQVSIALSEYKDMAERLKDTNYTVLCELGVGLNRWLDGLRGNAIRDTKLRGAVTLALGDATRNGGDVFSQVHMDIVLERASLWIAGIKVVHKGKLEITA